VTLAERPPGELYPFSSHYLEIRGLRLHYLDEGPRDAPPVLMLHGNPTWSFYYRNLVMALRDRYRCIVPDHVGCGLSDKPGDDAYDYRLKSRIEDLDALLNHLDLSQPLTLVVHDWGGMIGFAWAVRNPERIDRLVVLNTAAFPLPATKRMPASLRLSRLPGVGAFLVRGLNLFARGATRFCVTERPMSPEVRRAYLAPYDSWAHRVAVLRFVEDIPLRPSDESWPTVERTAEGLQALRDRPMRVFWGMRDFVFDHHFLAEWQRRFPDAAVRRFEKAGHYVLEDAADRIVPEVVTFLGSGTGHEEASP
jgi:pimeloyl-ACP methyl ester carboxylesterase